MDNMENFYFKIGDIDAIRGIKTPHERDLNDLGNDRISLLRNLRKDDLFEIVQKIDGRIVDLDLAEEWAVSKEFFNGVSVIILYQYYGNEFGDDLVDEIQFRFAGEHVQLVSGEDLCHFSEIFVNLIDLIINKSKHPNIYKGNPSNMLKTGLEERTEPFFMIQKENYKEIADFMGGNYSDEAIFKITIEPIPNFVITINSSINDRIDFKIMGNLVEKLSVYDSERLIMMSVNHMLRYIKLVIGEKSPDICNKMFSGYYKEKYPEKFE